MPDGGGVAVAAATLCSEWQLQVLNYRLLQCDAVAAAAEVQQSMEGCWTGCYCECLAGRVA